MEGKITQLSSALAGLADCAENIKKAQEYEPADGSPASKEWSTTSPFQREIRTCHGSIWLLIMAAQDHVFSLSRLLSLPLTQFAHMAVIRAAIENAARAYWLLDPDLDLRERAGRGLTERFASLQEMIGVLTLTDAKQAEEKKRRLAQLISTATELGFSVKKGGHPERYFLAEIRRPSATSLAGSILPETGKAMYKLSSAATHGTTYALMLNYRVEPDAEEERRGWITNLVPQLEISSVAVVMSAAAMAFRRAFEKHMNFLGWQSNEWTSYADHVEKVLAKHLVSGPAAQGSHQ